MVFESNNPIVIESSREEQCQYQANAKGKKEVMEIAFFLGDMFLHFILGAQFIEPGVYLYIFYSIIGGNDCIEQRECPIRVSISIFIFRTALRSNSDSCTSTAALSIAASALR